MEPRSRFSLFRILPTVSAGLSRWCDCGRRRLLGGCGVLFIVNFQRLKVEEGVLMENEGWGEMGFEGFLG